MRVKSDNSKCVSRKSSGINKSGLNDSSISNAYVQEMISKTGLDLKSYKDLVREKAERMNQMEENQKLLIQSQERKWLAKHGKSHLIDFDDKERHQLKSYFLQLDQKNQGFIGMEQLEDPFISMGIASNRQEIQKIIDSVDEDKSGQIEFGEFLSIIKGGNGGENSSVIIEFFKDMIKGEIAGASIPKQLSFNLIISNLRRKKFLDAITSKDDQIKQSSEQIMQNYSKMMSQRLADTEQNNQ